MLTTPDPYPKLSPTYGMDRRLRMPMGTLPLSKTKSYQWDGLTIKDANGIGFSSKTKSYLWDGLVIKDAYRHLILIQTGWIDNQGCPQAPNPHPYEMNRQPRIPTIKDANGT